MKTPRVILGLMQVAGLVFLVLGMFQVAAWLGLSTLGIALFVVGLYLESNWPEKGEQDGTGSP